MHELRRSAAVVFVLLIAVSAMAQRHSRDKEQGYFNKPGDPILNIEDALTKKWTYLRLSDLKRRKVTELQIPNIRAEKPAVFEGILLNELLVRGRLASRSSKTARSR